MNHLLPLINSQKNLLNLYKQEIESAYIAAKSLNTAITYINDIEMNEKEVNAFVLANSDIPGAGIPQSAISSLQNTAGLCPFAYGQSVYKARSILSLLGIYTDYDDKANCSALGYLRNLNPAGSSPDRGRGMVVVPNPARSEATAYLLMPTRNPSCITISDICGKKIKTILLNENVNKIEINIENFVPGLFFISLSEKEQLTITEKFTVIK